MTSLTDDDRAEIKRLARTEALNVLREYLERKRLRAAERVKREEKNHDEAMLDCFGHHGQG